VVSQQSADLSVLGCLMKAAPGWEGIIRRAQ